MHNAYDEKAENFRVGNPCCSKRNSVDKQSLQPDSAIVCLNEVPRCN